MTEIVRNFTYVRADVERKAKHNGWRLDGMPNFDPCFATHVVMHDAFEHQPGDVGDIEHEMMAFGAMFLIRIRGKWDRGNWAGREHLSNGSDIGGFLSSENWKIKPCAYPIHDDIITHLEKVKDYIVDGHRGDNKVTACLDNAMRWISLGYVRALFRWKGAKPRQICAMIERLGEKLELLEREHAEIRGFFTHRMAHGSKLTITFDPENLTASLSVIPANKKLDTVNW